MSGVAIAQPRGGGRSQHSSPRPSTATRSTPRTQVLEKRASERRPGSRHGDRRELRAFNRPRRRGSATSGARCWCRCARRHARGSGRTPQPGLTRVAAPGCLFQLDRRRGACRRSSGARHALDASRCWSRRPVFPGHTLVVPAPARGSASDVAPRCAPRSSCSAGDQRAVAAAVHDAIGAQGTFVAMNNVVSQSVPHLHVARRTAQAQGRVGRASSGRGTRVRRRRGDGGGRRADPRRLALDAMM